MESQRVVFSIFKKMKPHLAMVSIQFGYAGMFIVTVLCLKRGLSHYVLAVYRHAAATIALAPFAFLLERNVRPKMTIGTFFRIMVLALLEPVIDQNLYYVGMRYTSASYAAAIYNVLPALTFIIAVFFRLENVSLKSIRSQAKILGTIITVGGAMMMTLYKGPVLTFLTKHGHHGTNHAAASSATTTATATNQHWLAGTFMLLAGCTGWSAFFIIQSFTVKRYPAELSLSWWICFLGTVQGGAVALVMERDFGAWKVGFDSRLVAPIYTGVVCSGITYYMQNAVIKEKGPVFVTAFTPLVMILVAALGSLILLELLHLGSVIGAIIIVIGLYCVLWGKRKEEDVSLSITSDEKGRAHQLPISTVDHGTIRSANTNTNTISADGYNVNVNGGVI